MGSAACPSIIPLSIWALSLELFEQVKIFFWFTEIWEEKKKEEEEINIAAIVLSFDCPLEDPCSLLRPENVFKKSFESANLPF